MPDVEASATTAAGERGETYEWVQLNTYGVVIGPSFTGTAAQLAAHLTAGLPAGLPVEPVGPPTEATVYVREVGAAVRCPLVTLRTPWGGQRWIPRQRPRRLRAHAWLLRR